MPAVKVKQTEKQWDRLVKRSEAIKAKEYELTCDLIAHTLRLPKLFDIPPHLRDEVKRMVKVAKQLDRALNQRDEVCDQMGEFIEGGQ